MMPEISIIQRLKLDFCNLLDLKAIMKCHKVKKLVSRGAVHAGVSKQIQLVYPIVTESGVSR